MRELIVAVGGILSVVAMAGAAATSVPDTHSSQVDIAKVNAAAQDTQALTSASAPRIFRYDVNVTRMNKTPTGKVVPRTAQQGSLEVLEKQPSFSQSTTQQAYVCLDEDKTSLTSCTVSYGYMFGVETEQVDQVTGKVEAKVTLNVTDLEAMLTHKTAAGDLGEPILSSFRVEQKTALTPGKSMHGVSGDYAYKVTLVEIR